MKVRMYPHPSELSNDSSGIAQVVINYARYLPDYGVEVVDPSATTYDLDAAHAAGLVGAMVNHCHGLLWTGERHYSEAGYWTNRDIVDSVKLAREVTVPSEWVGKTFQRDMRMNPYVIPHGVNWDEWQDDRTNEGYILWGKNRTSDGLDPTAISEVARAFPDLEFVTTFGVPGMPKNVKVLGHALPHDQMRTILQSAAVLLATDKETWGIQHAEAMACGVPVLSVDMGAVPEFMPHGVAGYCFQPGNVQDAVNGLAYCLEYRDQLGANGRELAREMTWQKACEMVADVYAEALTIEQPTVAVVIPCYNYGHKLGRAIESVSAQDYPLLTDIVVVNDGSTDNTLEVARQWQQVDKRIVIADQENRGVAEARNRGYQCVATKYVLFLDADDYIEPGYISLSVPALESNPAIGVAYTGNRVILQDGTEILPWDWGYQPEEGQLISDRIWPQEFDYETQLSRSNQVPTCCLVRRKALLRANGYRSRYCPNGAGSEDAELWLRLGALGWHFQYVPSEPHALFVHTHGEGNVSGNVGYTEPDWTSWHPWTKDGKHPFASIATPENGISHKIYSYDNPLVSVIIPVGPAHDEHLQNALDSLDAQTFRGWEAIVVNDSGEPLQTLAGGAYPHVTVLTTSGSKGAGVARNTGVYVAKAPLLAFLDADDYYHAGFLKRCVESYMQTHSVIYTDYVSTIPGEMYPQAGMRLMEERPDGSVLVSARFDNFDQDRAMTRPGGDRPYIWAGITILLPKSWHEQLGGFDEDMETWEDCDYLLRLAWHGHNFHRLPEELWIYDFTSGTRRFDSEGNEPALIEHLAAKYDKIMAVMQDKELA